MDRLQQPLTRTSQGDNNFLAELISGLQGMAGNDNNQDKPDESDEGQESEPPHILPFPYPQSTNNPAPTGTQQGNDEGMDSPFEMPPFPTMGTEGN